MARDRAADLPVMREVMNEKHTVFCELNEDGKWKLRICLRMQRAGSSRKTGASRYRSFYLAGKGRTNLKWICITAGAPRDDSLARIGPHLQGSQFIRTFNLCFRS